MKTKNPSLCPCSCCVSVRRINEGRGSPSRTDGVGETSGSSDWLLSRRRFVGGLGLAVSAALLARGWAAPAVPLASFANARAPLRRRPLRLQPVLTYETPQRREATSWRNWGGIQSDEAARQEQARIERELEQMGRRAEFPLQILPVQAVKTPETAAQVARTAPEVMLLYGAGGWLNLLETLVRPDRFNLMFLRHDPGPAYLWYEIVHPRFLRKTVDEFGQPGMDVHDLVVDRYDELLWRLRALYALHNTYGKKVVCIGGPGGWGEGGREAPRRAREVWKLEMVDCPYPELERRLKAAFGNAALMADCEQAARAYLAGPGVKLETSRQFVVHAFVLKEVFLDLLAEHQTDALTVHHCMGPIMGIAQTTACLTLTLLNDEGYLLFCESDFVVIPSGILLHYISGKPVFLHNPTTPHDGLITLAHCTAPRRMDGKRLERVRILTHFESDYGAAPKVEMKRGQITTHLGPDFQARRWVGFRGTIQANPFFEICRSQVDVKIHGDWRKLLEQMRGFHWMLCYGDYLRESEYALRKAGVEFLNLSSTPA